MKYLSLLLIFISVQLHALTFKSDGTVVNDRGTIFPSSEKKDDYQMVGDDSLNPSRFAEIFSKIDNYELSFIPNNPETLPDVIYRGVTADQWKIIEKIGDPLNCKKKVFDLQKIEKNKFYELSTDICKNERCIKNALKTNDYILLREGTYSLHWGLDLKGKILIGADNEQVILDASNADIGISLKNSVLSNVIIQNSKDVGISLHNDNLIYRVVVGNSGVFSDNSSKGIGIEQDGTWGNVKNNCLVSTESYNGFNNLFGFGQKCVGCSADGYDAKHSATNITFIDSHGHHNGDHGFDFFMSGRASKVPLQPVIRVFYSSGTYSGKNPYRQGGDGGGWKLDGDEDQFYLSEDRSIPKLVYGSVSCFNKDHGFSKPGNTRLNFINNSIDEKNSKRGNYILSGYNYKNYNINFWGNAQTDDPYVLKCEDFKEIKTIRSFDIPLEEPKYYVVN